ncbi:hypothetical protein BaRGS_00020240 [Batillaria attramentaria]|uniref:BRCT domain-containing protein n=1 Tax=Batillaria attramentaria TaxID=370345 RepID=A0ABD0KNJ2_9CAEN
MDIDATQVINFVELEEEELGGDLTTQNQHKLMFLSPEVRYELKHNDQLTFGDVICTYIIGEKAPVHGDSGSETDEEAMEKADADEDCDSDASSDILQPTQPVLSAVDGDHLTTREVEASGGFGPCKLSGDTAIAVMETPEFSRKSSRSQGGATLVLPDSESETDGELPQETLVFNDDSEDRALNKPRAAKGTDATQAYGGSEDEESDSNVDMDAATQAIGLGENKTLEEESDVPQFESTQMYTMDTDLERSEDVDPRIPNKETAGVATDTNKKDSSKLDTSSAKVVYSTSDAHIMGDSEKDGRKEDIENLNGLFTTSTLACDMSDEEMDVEVKTKHEGFADGVYFDDVTQVMEDMRATENVAAGVNFDDATQAIDDSHTSDDVSIKVTSADATQVIDESHATEDVTKGDDATQPIDDNSTSKHDSEGVNFSDATLAINEIRASKSFAENVIVDDATLAITDGHATKGMNCGDATRAIEDSSTTQGGGKGANFDDATLAIDDDCIAEDVSKGVNFDDTTQLIDDNRATEERQEIKENDGSGDKNRKGDKQVVLGTDTGPTDHLPLGTSAAGDTLPVNCSTDETNMVVKTDEADEHCVDTEEMVPESQDDGPSTAIINIPERSPLKPALVDRKVQKRSPSPSPKKVAFADVSKGSGSEACVSPGYKKHVQSDSHDEAVKTSPAPLCHFESKPVVSTGDSTEQTKVEDQSKGNPITPTPSRGKPAVKMQKDDNPHDKEEPLRQTRRNSRMSFRKDAKKEVNNSLKSNEDRVQKAVGTKKGKKQGNKPPGSTGNKPELSNVATTTSQLNTSNTEVPTKTTRIRALPVTAHSADADDGLERSGDVASNDSIGPRRSGRSRKVTRGYSPESAINDKSRDTKHASPTTKGSRHPLLQSSTRRGKQRISGVQQQIPGHARNVEKEVVTTENTSGAKGTGADIHGPAEEKSSFPAKQIFQKHASRSSRSRRVTVVSADDDDVAKANSRELEGGDKKAVAEVTTVTDKSLLSKKKRTASVESRQPGKRLKQSSDSPGDREVVTENVGGNVALSKAVPDADGTSKRAHRTCRATRSEDQSQDVDQERRTTSEGLQVVEHVAAKRGKQTRNQASPVKSAADSPSLRRSTLNSKPRVLFTGVIDEQGQKIVKDLGGDFAKSVQDCTHLVTDRIRRTVKFLGGLARGVMIVTHQWLESCKSSGMFVDASVFVVQDPQMEKKYKFSLVTSVQKASQTPLLQGYKVHVTKSVRPEPLQMKEILQCAGAEYLPTMPHRAGDKTLVISSEEDITKCSPAISADLPVMSAEFILTGILRQELDMERYPLKSGVNVTNSAPAKNKIRISINSELCLNHGDARGSLMEGNRIVYNQHQL